MISLSLYEVNGMSAQLQKVLQEMCVCGARPGGFVLSVCSCSIRVTTFKRLCNIVSFILILVSQEYSVPFLCSMSAFE